MNKWDHTQNVSVVFRSWLWSSAVSPQVTETINVSVGCHYLCQALGYLPATEHHRPAHWLVPYYTAWWQMHVCTCAQLAQDCSAEWRPGLKPATCWLQVRLPKHSATEPHTQQLYPVENSAMLILWYLYDPDIHIIIWRVRKQRNLWNQTNPSLNVS